MTHRPLLGALAGLTLGFGGALMVLESVERGRPVDPQETVVGTPDINQHCQDMGPSFSAVLQSTDAYGWQCSGITSGIWETRTVDLAEVCVGQFGSAAYSTPATRWRGGASSATDELLSSVINRPQASVAARRRCSAIAVRLPLPTS